MQLTAKKTDSYHDVLVSKKKGQLVPWEIKKGTLLGRRDNACISRFNFLD